MKVNIIVGYTKNGLRDYKHWERKNLLGTDVTIIDGIGNEIIIGSREKGTLITVNGKTIKDME